MEVDKKDMKILYEMDLDARKPLTKIAKTVRLPKQVVSYRIKRMEKDGIIRGYRAMADLHRLGYYTYRLYIRLQNIDPHNEDEIIRKFMGIPNMIWLILTTGRWDLEILFAARNAVHFNRLLAKIKSEVGDHILEFVISPSIVNYHFRRSYLLEKPEIKETIQPYGFEPEIERLDRTDFKILKYLALNGKATFSEIGANAGLTYNGAKKRVDSLEKRNILSGYRIWFNYEKAGRQFYKALVSMNRLDDITEKKLVGFCAAEPSSIYLVLCSGGWDLEIEAEVESESEFRNLLVRFRNQFRDQVKDYDILHSYSELIENYFPFTEYNEFELKIKK